MTYSNTLRAPRPPVPPKSRPNQFELFRRIKRSAKYTRGEKLVLEALVDHGYRSGVCTASIRTLARETNLSERYVRQVEPKLATAGLIRIERETGSQHSRRTIFLEDRLLEGRLDPDPAEVHAVGTPEVHAVGTPMVHLVGTPMAFETSPPGPPYMGNQLDDRQAGSAGSSFVLPPKTDPDPRTISLAAEALDPALLAVLTAGVVAMFAYPETRAAALVQSAARTFPAAWIGPALEKAQKFKPRVREWTWGVVIGILKNWLAEGGPPPEWPKPSVSPAAAILQDFADRGWDVMPDGRFKLRGGFSEGRKAGPDLARRYEAHKDEVLKLAAVVLEKRQS
jgi:hypothetical protein